jgi:hypothetical protein
MAAAHPLGDIGQDWVRIKVFEGVGKENRQLL